MNPEPCGPKTKAGKARSRGNAFKHGLCATNELFLAHLRHRERKVFNRLYQTMVLEYNPQTEQEKLLVDRLAIEHFRLYRLYDLEHAATRQSRSKSISKESIIPYLDRISRYDSRLERQIGILHNRLYALYFKRGNHSLSHYSSRE
jgi:hypothetical protein